MQQYKIYYYFKCSECGYAYIDIHHSRFTYAHDCYRCDVADIAKKVGTLWQDNTKVRVHYER